jgi:hypothetical protein
MSAKASRSAGSWSSSQTRKGQAEESLTFQPAVIAPQCEARIGFDEYLYCEWSIGMSTFDNLEEASRSNATRLRSHIYGIQTITMLPFLVNEIVI